MRQMRCKAMLCLLFGMELILAALPTLARGCAVCAGSDEHAGYFWGVLFLMAMPFAVSGLIGGWVLYSYRRGQADLSPSASTPIAEQRMLLSPATTSVSDAHDNGSQTTHAGSFAANDRGWLPREKERTP
jgi:hypothetical protein